LSKGFAPETWAYGMRNPWRITCDPVSGQIWLGQNGQDLWEYAHLVKKGDNYGWSVTEGSHPFFPHRKAGPTPITPPTVEHSHAEARSLTGGVVYRGTKLPELVGAYIYGDYSTGHIWAVKHDGTRILWHKKIAVTTIKLAEEGKLFGDGERRLHRIVMAQPTDKVPALFRVGDLLALLGDEDATRRSRQETGDKPQQRGLARAIGAFQRQRLACLDAKRQALEQAACAAGAGQLLGGEGGDHGRAN
jgi:hypothetical protein